MRHQKTRNKLSRDSRPSQGAADEPLQGGHRARADQDDRGEGQGRQARAREADHARQARRPARAPPGAVDARPGQVRGPQAVRGGRAALRGAPGRLHAHPQARPASQRLDRDGLPRAGLSVGARASGCAGGRRELDARVRRRRLRRLGAPARAAHGAGGARARRCAIVAAATTASPLTVAGRTDAACTRGGRSRSYEHEAVDPRALNALLPADVAVLAREPARRRLRRAPRRALATYCYRVLTGARARRGRARTRAVVAATLDREALHACAAALLGTHDFTAFTPTETDHVRFERDVARGASGASDGDLLEFWIEADTFMRHMNRVLVGTMLEVAAGRRTRRATSSRCSTGAPRARGRRDRAAARAGAGGVGYDGATPTPAERPLGRTMDAMRVLLTNDDGIEAEGLQALRRALLELPGIELAVIAPDGNRSATARSITTRRPLWVEEVDFGDGTRRLRDRRHAGRLRAPRRARADRGLRRPSSSSPASTTARTSATTSPTRARSRRRSRALLLGLPAIAVSQQSAAREMDFRLGRRVRLRRRGARSPRGSSSELDDVPLPRGHAAQRQRPGGEPTASRSRGWASGSTATSSSSSDEAPTSAGRYRIYGDATRLPRRAGHRPRRGRRRPHRGHADPLRPDRHARASTRWRATTSRGCSRPPRARSE